MRTQSHGKCNRGADNRSKLLWVSRDDNLTGFTLGALQSSNRHERAWFHAVPTLVNENVAKEARREVAAVQPVFIIC